MKVFSLERSNHNLSRAEMFGRIEYIFPSGDWRPSMWSDEYLQEILDRLDQHHFLPEVDAIVITGHLVPVVMLAAIVMKKYGTFQGLFFNAVSQDYELRRL